MPVGRIPLFAILAFALLSIPLSCLAATISDYRVIRQPVVDARGELQVAIRSFQSDGVRHLLLVNPDSLETCNVAASTVSAAKGPAAAGVAASPFLSAIGHFTGAPHRLQNDGATHAANGADGVFLTVDLCPSHRPFEQELFAAAEDAASTPVPVAVSISGLWLVKHPGEVAFLKQQVAAGKLDITWVNHSYHHPYDPRAPLERNFLLTHGVDFRREVLDLEEQLLAHGIVPSPFFRFPGLVSDAATMGELRELSLIPIGSDAWLAKGERPKKGSFILVHGNGNEPKGIKLVLPMLKNKELHLLPLRRAFAPE